MKAFYILYAWESRTTEYADKVTEAQFELMHKRLLEAKEALEASWKADPKSATAPTLMIDVELGIGQGDRDATELWFRRALEIDPDNRVACLAKLNWLKPKWYGSPELMLEFGKQCRDTKYVRSKIPLIVADVHYALSFLMKEEDRNPYINSDEVFHDIQRVFSEYLEIMPGDLAARTDYAAFCYLGSRTFEALRHFDIIGDKVADTKNFKLDWLKRARIDAKKIAAEAEAQGDCLPHRFGIRRGGRGRLQELDARRRGGDPDRSESGRHRCH